MSRIAVAMILLSLLAACQQQQQEKIENTVVDQAPDRVLLAVAASTRDVVEEQTKEFTQTTKVQVEIASGSSASLARQIESEAPIDIFLSAHSQWGESLQSKGFVAEIVPLLTNRLVLIVPRGNPAGVHDWKDLMKPGVAHVALAGETVPAGVYAREVLDKLDLMAQLYEQAKIVRGQDVRQTLVYVERGEAEAGIVYQTDANKSNKVEIIKLVPADLHEPIVYPLILLNEGAKKAYAQRLFEFLQSPKALAAYEKRGFGILKSRESNRTPVR